jgi:signal peptidase I
VIDNWGDDWIKRVVAVAGQTVRQDGTVLSVDGVRYEQTAPDGTAAVDDAGIPVGTMTRSTDSNETSNRWYDRVASHKTETMMGKDGKKVAHSIYNDMPPVTVDWPMGMTTINRPGLTCTDDGCTVKEGYVIVMGDNRDNSNDGRRWGAVPVDNVKGRAVFVFVSVDGSTSSVKLGHFELPGIRWGRTGNAL